MFAGLALIAAGVGLLLAAGSFLRDAEGVNTWLARRARDDATPAILRRGLAFNARWGARSTVWFGRLVGLAAIAGGTVLLVQT